MPPLERISSDRVGEMPALPVPREEEAYNAGDQLTRAAAARGERRLLAANGRSVSGREVAARALAFQHALAARGVAGGERVLLVMRDTPAFFAAFLGALRGGCMPVPISTSLPAKDVAFIARDAGVRAAVVDRALPAAFGDP